MRPSGQETLTWLSAIVESCDDAVIGSQIDGTILSWNRGAERLYGYSAAEAIGQPVSILVPPDRLGELAKIQGTLRRGEPVPLLETVRRGKDGRPVEVSISISPIVQNGIIVGASAIARSAAERRRFEESLRDREERLSSALMASQTGTFRWHIATDVLEWDESLRRIFGITPEEPIRKAEDFLALVHAEDRPVVWAEVQRCLHEGGEFSAEFRIIRPDGAVRWIADRARLFPDKDGLPAYLTGACRDITQEKASEERLRAALAEKEALLARLQLLMKEVNHRVKNSLQTVASLLSLQGRHATSPEVRDQLADARSRVMTVAGVHERLYQSGRIGLVELPEYLQGLCADLANTLVEPPGSITIAAEAIDVALPADRVIPLGLIVTELVTNAIRHACPDGRGAVQVVARQVAIDQLAVSVRDSGIGLRSDGHSNERSGFGMKLVDGLTQQLGGTLELRHQSSGTEVVVTLPLATSTAERARDKLSATARQKRSGQTLIRRRFSPPRQSHPRGMTSGHLLADRRLAFGLSLREKGDLEGALSLIEQALELVPAWPEARFALAETLALLGRKPEALAAYRHYLAEDPADAMGAAARMHLLDGSPPPAQLPQTYLRTLFDQYAPRYEESLRQRLSYRAPELLREAVDAAHPSTGHPEAVLDLGCGTGLAGAAFRDRASWLEGIDLSPRMVALAERKGIYDRLHVGEIAAFLAAPPRAYGLIIAADVLVYFGELEPVFGSAAAALAPDGLCAVTLQRGEAPPFALGAEQRYRHAPDYVAQAAAASGLRVERLQEASYRTEAGQPVAGLIVLMRRTAR